METNDIGKKTVILGGEEVTISLQELISLKEWFCNDGYEIFSKINDKYKKNEIGKVLDHVGGDVEDLYIIQSINFAHSWIEVIKSDVNEQIENWELKEE